MKLNNTRMGIDRMIKKFIIGLFLLVSVGAFGQQKANYELAERFRRVTQVPLTKNSLEVHPRYINNTDRFCIR